MQKMKYQGIRFCQVGLSFRGPQTIVIFVSFLPLKNQFSSPWRHYYLTHLGMHGVNKARQHSCPTSPPTQKKAGGGMKEGGEGRPLSPKPVCSVYS